MKTILLNYTLYNHWANSRLINIIKTSAMSLLDIETKSSFNTIRKTLYHIMGTEEIWYKRLNGESINYWPGDKFVGTLEEFTNRFLKGSLLLKNYVESRSSEELSSMLIYKNMSGNEFQNRIYNIIQHCVNHSTHHRGQLYTMMRSVGITGLQSIDYITFVREIPGE